MKIYIPAILVLVVLAVLFGVGFLATGLFASPETRFNRQVDQNVEQAQRLLAQYEGGQPLLLDALQRLSAVKPEPSTQPAAEQPAADDFWGEGDDLLSQHARDLAQKRGELGQEFERMGGSTETVAAGVDSQEELQQRIQANADLLAKALQAVRDAIGVTEGELSGSSHPVATRLEAMLIYRQADLQRRQAAVHQARAEAEYRAFAEVLATWRDADNRVKTIQSELAGSAGDPGRPAATQPAAGTVPPMDERIQRLQAEGQKVDAQIAEAQKEVDRLSAAVDQVKQKLDKARSQADAAVRRMMELQEAPIDASDPNAMKRFTDQYSRATRQEREASREADTLEHGMLRNARPDADEENEILTAPLVPAKPGQKIETEPGLNALEADLRAAKALVETREALRQQINARIKGIQGRQEQLKADLAKAQTWRDGLAKDALGRAQAATAEAIKAGKLEHEAIALITDQGLPAAQRAESAATGRGSEIQDFYRKQAAGSPQVGFMGGHVQALVGDLELERALLLAQQANGLRRQERILAGVVQAGMDPAKLAAGTENGLGTEAADTAGIPATQPQAISQAAEQARTKALEAAKAALDAYAKASEQLDRLWLVHTQIAAVHYLMSSLTTGDEAQRHREEAVREFQLATRDRADRPESKAYRSLVEAPQP